ncbi:MAG TPA: 4,5-DOPA dioxygenase extradiol [Cytophagaceae bacterium]|jgi:4,5-DOPA dioxygenase extradiol
MNRKEFLKTISLIPFLGSTMNLKALQNFKNDLEYMETMPVLFLGHGNPMYAIQDNEFTKAWSETGKSLPTPKAILVISAHWETNGTFVTAMEKPKTIHDFGGFPKQLFDVQYPSPGSPEVAKQTRDILKKTSVQLDHNWGLDHGTWSVVKHLYPKANIPVLQMSIDYSKDLQWHYELAQELSVLRQKGILIIGSGNMVHNLRMAQFDLTVGHDWAIKANELLKERIIDNDHHSLINFSSLGKEVRMAIPSAEHYIPMLYALGLKTGKESVSIFNDKTELGAISMTSFKINS